MGSLLLTFLFPALSWGWSPPPPPTDKPRLRATLEGHEFCVWGLAFGPDGKHLASAGGPDSTARLWDVRTGKRIAILRGHLAASRFAPSVYLNEVAFSPSGRVVATGSDDRTVKLWEVATGREIVTFRCQAPISVLRFSPDGKGLFANGDAMRLWDLNTGRARVVLKRRLVVPVVGFTPAGKLLVASIDDYPLLGSFTLWDVEANKVVSRCRGHTKAIISLVFSGDGKLLASAAWDGTIRLWDTVSGKHKCTFADQPGVVVRLAFSPNGGMLAVSSTPAADRNDYPGTVRLLEVPSGKLLATLEGHRRTIGRLVFSPDGRLLATGDGEGTIKLWELPHLSAVGK